MDEPEQQASPPDGMIYQLFLRSLTGVTRHRTRILFFLLLLIPVSLLGLTRIRLGTNIEAMLPADKDVVQGIEFLRTAGLSDTIALSVTPAHSGIALSSLFGQLDRLGDDLAKLPLVDAVTLHPPVENVVRDITSFCHYTPQLIDIKGVPDLEDRLKPATINQAVNSMFNQLLSPGGGFALPFFRNDPLGFSRPQLRALQNLATAGGYQIKVDQGYLLSRDGNHALIILESSVPVTAGAESKQLLKSLSHVLRKHASVFSTLVVSGHRHAVSNETIIRRDVKRACVIAGLGFFLLFFLGWRDARAGIIFVIPFFAVLLAINMTSLILGTLSYFILGMAGVVTGISIDYGIHVYVAQKEGGLPSVAYIFKPVTVGALTTVSVFASFFFSSVSGYGELACFSILSIVLSLILALYIIPILVKPGGLPFRNSLKNRGRYSQRERWIILTTWILFLLTGVVLIPGLRFDTDIRSFDGSAPEIFDDEASFQAIWSDEVPPAFLVVKGPDFETAFAEYSRISQQAQALLNNGELKSLTSLWQPRSARQTHRDNWQAFWTDQRRQNLKEHLAAATAKFGFADDVFTPFVSWLDNPPAVEATEGNEFPASLQPFKPLLKRFVVQTATTTTLLAYFPDTPENIDRLSALKRTEKEHYFLVSRNMLARSMSQAIQSEIFKLSVIAIGLIVVLLFALLHRPGRVLLASIPVITALVCMFGILRHCDPITRENRMISAFLCLGLRFFRDPQLRLL
jgi:predicted exporter